MNNCADTTASQRAGFQRGSASADAIAKDIHARSDGDDFALAYLANHFSSLCGFAAATIGHEATRGLVHSLVAVVDTGLQMVESGSSWRVQ